MEWVFRMILDEMLLFNYGFLSPLSISFRLLNNKLNWMITIYLLSCVVWYYCVIKMSECQLKGPLKYVSTKGYLPFLNCLVGIGQLFGDAS